MTDRCSAAHHTDPSPCEGATDAVLLRDRHGAEKLGCVHHAARLRASLKVAVFPGPSAYTGYAWGHDAPREALARAQRMTPYDWQTATA
ncbi:hypothetical protein ACF05T_34315 [Streptomyces lateritius]|uniref:Uncharacterized protein n=1 Tax=Streptomyces lateritius TaxID=67313 RepID=A0ABW6YMX8_9ACTN